MLSHPKGGGATRDRGDPLGGFLSRRTRMLPVRKSGGPGKEVPPERTRTNQKKRTIRYWEVLRKNAETFFDKMDGICLPR